MRKRRNRRQNISAGICSRLNLCSAYRSLVAVREPRSVTLWEKAPAVALLAVVGGLVFWAF